VRDPHVTRLFFTAEPRGNISYKTTVPPIVFHNNLGHFALREGVLAVEPADHFPTGDAARQAIEPLLRAWEIESDLRREVGAIRFTFDRAELVDRDPPPPGMPTVHSGQVVAMGMAVVSAIAHVIRGQYPAPPTAFRTTIDVEAAYRRWLGYREGREPLQGMAYFVLTLIEVPAGGSKSAAKVFNISSGVLDRMGQLSAEGDAQTARKLQRGRALRPLSGEEADWLDHAVRRVIRRLGEHASGATLPPITLKNVQDH